MNLLVFDRSYYDFVNWRSEVFPFAEVDGSISFVGTNHNVFLSVPRNTLYVANCPLTDKDRDLINLRYLIQIRIERAER